MDKLFGLSRRYELPACEDTSFTEADNAYAPIRLTNALLPRITLAALDQMKERIDPAKRPLAAKSGFRFARLMTLLSLGPNDSGSSAEEYEPIYIGGQPLPPPLKSKRRGLPRSAFIPHRECSSLTRFPPRKQSPREPLPIT